MVITQTFNKFCPDRRNEEGFKSCKDFFFRLSINGILQLLQLLLLLGLFCWSLFLCAFFHCSCLSWPFFWVAHCDDLRLLRPEVATVGCCRRQQHLSSHRNPYSRPEAAIFTCGRRQQDFFKSHVPTKIRMYGHYANTIRDVIYLFCDANRSGRAGFTEILYHYQPLVYLDGYLRKIYELKAV